MLFELNIYTGEMGERELTNTYSFRRDICNYYLPFISLLIPIHQYATSSTAGGALRLTGWVMIMTIL